MGRTYAELEYGYPDYPVVEAKQPLTPRKVAGIQLAIAAGTTVLSGTMLGATCNDNSAESHLLKMVTGAINGCGWTMLFLSVVAMIILLTNWLD